MLELNSPYRKNKVNLEDYDWQADIQNRLMLSNLKGYEFDALEEILFGPPKRSIEDLADDLSVDTKTLLSALDKFKDSGLFQLKDNNLILNKEKRKYFESQIAKFESNFVPGMEYLQSLLKKVPYHILLTWYPIPRTADNIFEAIVEKYLASPQIFQRYLMELNFGNDAMTAIVDDVFNSDNLLVLGKDLKEKYNLSDEKFEEVMLHLEFNFVCCLTYRKTNDDWEQVVTPFYEWKQYLKFLKSSRATPIASPSEVIVFKENEFAFVEDLTALLNLCKKEPIALIRTQGEKWAADPAFYKKIASVLTEGSDDDRESFKNYVSDLIEKLIFLRLVDISDSSLVIHKDADEWLALSVENRALASYKQTLSKLDLEPFSKELATERNVREIEKNLNNVIHTGWVYFDEFMKGMAAPISEDTKIVLKKVGKNWEYALPNYNDEEKDLIKKTVLKWLFETGLVSIGTHDNKPCFRVTSFGQSIFS